MNKALTNFIVDAFAFVAIVLLVSSGSLLQYKLPAGSGHFLKLWGMDRHEWGQIHLWTAIVLLAATLIHLCLHWRWIVGMIKGSSSTGKTLRITLSFACIVILLGAAIVPILSPIEESGEPPHKMQMETHPASVADQINGSMTFEEVERLTGISSSVILKELGLPNDTPINERLGRMRKKYNFEMHDIRDIVQKHLPKE
jgi:hypothetical protein